MRQAMRWTGYASVASSLLAACHSTPAARMLSDGAAQEQPMADAALDAANGTDGSEAGPAKPDARDGQAVSEDGSTQQSEGGTQSKPPRHTFVYVGGWDFGNATSYPFHTFSLDRASGALTDLGTLNLGPNPSMVTRSADGRFLYVGNEQGDANGGVTVASVDQETGALTKIDHESAEGVDVVFTSLTPGGGHLLAASYGGGRAFVFPVAADGTLSPLSDSLSFGGAAQTHSIRAHPNGRWAFAPNKNLDDVAQLSFDADQGTLTPQAFGALDTAPGAGPRHIAFDRAGDHLYLINENDSTLGAYDVSSEGKLSELETVSSLPSDFNGTNKGAHVLLAPSGGHLYASNRGHDSIAVFSIDASGGLTLVEHEPTRGQTPRHFDIDDRGELLVVANQDSGSIAVMRIEADGSLSALGDVVSGLMQPNSVAIVDLD